jgi:hypothetical protein
VVDSGKENPKQQNHYGSGPLISGDNYGAIHYETLDPKTKSWLAKLSEDAPDLAALLRKALRDGFISPDTADALRLAARNINEDVADALLLAGRNINEDVAQLLAGAGQNINNEVAQKFDRVNEDLSNTASELECHLISLRETVGELNTRQGSSNAGVVIQPSPRNTDNWWFRFRLICASLGVGVPTGAILVHYRLVAYVVVAAWVCLILSTLPWIADALRRTGL